MGLLSMENNETVSNKHITTSRPSSRLASSHSKGQSARFRPWTAHSQNRPNVRKSDENSTIQTRTRPKTARAKTKDYLNVTRNSLTTKGDDLKSQPGPCRVPSGNDKSNGVQTKQHQGSWSQTELPVNHYSSRNHTEQYPPQNDDEEEDRFTRCSDFSDESDDLLPLQERPEVVAKTDQPKPKSAGPKTEPPEQKSVKADIKEEEEKEDASGTSEDGEERGPTEGQTLESWLTGSAYNSDDYDTDLEEDFPPEPEPPVDPTGAYNYEEGCTKQGIVPVSYLVRNLGEGNLRMRHHYLGGVGTKPLAHALKSNTICEEIDLSDNYVEGGGATALAGMLKDNMFVVNLNISHNFIKSEGAAAFSEMLESNTTLKTLSLKGNQLSDWDAKKISDAMKNNMSLVCLDLSNNCFGEKAGVHLAVGIASNIGLNDLDLSWNGIREKGAVAVAKALSKNSSLEIFDISWNGFAHNGTMALAQSIRVNKSLKVLDISNNRIDTEAAVKFAQGLARNKGLETLLLGMNPIGEDGVEALLKGIEANKSLKLVGLEGCVDISVSPRLQVKLKEITSQRDIMIMYSSGSPQQSKMNQTILLVFERFISENADRMEDLFNQMDKTKTGMITLEEFKYGLKDFGLRLTSRQMDLLLDELDADRSGTIELEELMAGSNMVEQEKQKRARAEKEAIMYQEGMSLVHNNNDGENKGKAS